MALLGSSLTNGVGLRLVLSPLGSNIVIRTACCSVGIVLSVYSTFKAIGRKDQDNQRKWLIYWAGWNVLMDLSALQRYLQTRFFFGGKASVQEPLCPFLLRHQTRVNRILTSANGEMVRLISTHLAEIELGRNTISKIFWLILRGVVKPDQPQGSYAIEDPAAITTDTETEADHEDWHQIEALHFSLEINRGPNHHHLQMQHVLLNMVSH